MNACKQAANGSASASLQKHTAEPWVENVNPRGILSCSKGDVHLWVAVHARRYEFMSPITMVK